MELVEVRRLTGPNLLLDGPGAVMDVAFAPADGDRISLSLPLRVADHRRVLAERGWQWGDDVAVRRWSNGRGATLAWSCPVDELYAACEVLEFAWEDILAGGTAGDAIGPERIETLLESAADERDPVLRAMLAAAAEHGVAGVWDDDDLSVGLGSGSLAWSRADVPSPGDVDWDAVHDVPAALVTGTNGKSTTVRMLASMLRVAGRHPGNSSTDGIVIDGELVEAGDWSGPGGGRTVARDPRVGTMVLEVARGGLLRRGLPVDYATVSVVTNISDDHLGEYGIESVQELTRAKLVVAKAVRDAGVLVTNAQDPLLLAAAPHGPRTWWFSLDPADATLAQAVADGATVLTVVEGVITSRTAAGDSAIVPVTDVPASMAGAAAHNVANALAAAAAAIALDVELPAIAEALRSFVPDAAQNPGRANRYDLNGVTIIVDFAHNVHGVTAMSNLVAALPATRRLVLFSQAGDRPDDALDALAAAVAKTAPDAYIVAEVPGYLRGREPMEVPNRLAAGLIRAGADPDAIQHVADAIIGTEQALDWASPGDALLLLVLEHRTEVTELLHARGAIEA